jgi:hypothetical protein
MVVLGEKLGGGPTDRSISELGIVSEAISLKSSRVRPILLMTSERLPYTETARRKRTNSVCGLIQEAYMSCISDSPYKVYINSNRHDSHILVTA